MKTIHLNGLKLHDWLSIDDGIFVQQEITGLEMPDIRTASYNRAGEHGINISNQLYGQRMITMRGAIYSPSRATFEEKRRALVNACKIDRGSNGFIIPKLLTFTTLDDLALQVQVYVNRFRMAKNKMHYAEYEIELIAPDIYLESQTQETVTINIVQDGGAVYPVTYPVTYGASSSANTVVNNTGPEDVYPIIDIYGPTSYPVITNQTTGKYLALDINIADGEVLTIDTRNRIILLGGVNSLYALDLESSWIYLAPGNNTINVATEGGAGHVDLRYRVSRLGV